MKTIEKLAREAGISTSRRNIFPPTFTKSYDFGPGQLERFVALVRAQALEEAADKCASMVLGGINADNFDCAGAIRALAKEPSPP